MTTQNTQGASWEERVEACFLTERDTSNGWPMVTVNPDTLLFTVQGLLSKERAEGERRGAERVVEFIKDYKFQTYSADTVLQEGDRILSRFSQEKELIKIKDLLPALEEAKSLPADSTEK